MKRVCRHCNSEFEPPTNWPRRYCSDLCRKKNYYAQRALAGRRKCKTCKSVILDYRCKKYCSKKCSDVGFADRSKILITCAGCNNQFKARRGDIASKESRGILNHYCSKHCFAFYRRERSKLYKECQSCGAVFTIVKHGKLCSACKQSEVEKSRHLKKIKNNIRTRILHCLKGKQKSSKTELLLGCSFNFFKSYLEAQFKKGMSWDNHGRSWHIDHKIPLAAFKTMDEREQKIAFHYTNTRPLPAKQNLEKNSKIIPSLCQLHFHI